VVELRTPGPSLPVAVATLDGRGCVAFANEDWLACDADGALAGPRHALGCDYVAACQDAASAGIAGAAELARGLEDLLAGRSQEATLHYGGRGAGARRFRIRARRTAHPEATGIALVHDDVTEAARARDTLERRSHYVRTMHELSSDLVVFLAPDRSVRWASPSLQNLLGYAPDAVIGVRPLGVIHPDDRGSVTGTNDDLLRDPGATHVVQVRARHADGRWRVFETWRRALIDDGELKGILVSARDVTERRATEAALRASEQRHRMIAEHAFELIVELDAERRIAYVNPAVEKTFGIEAAAWIGQDIGLVVKSVCHPDDQERNDAAMAELLASGRPVRLMNRVRRHDGEWRWLETHGRHFSTRDDVLHFVVISRDITQQIFDAAAQRAHADRLQEVGRLRSLETLAQGVAHDFNNLLVGVLGNLELTLADGRVPASLVPCLEDARTAGLRAAELVVQLLTFSGLSPRRNEQLDLAELVARLLPDLRASTPAHAAIHAALMPGLPRVEGDAAQLRQVVVNLVLNAGDAIAERGGKIELSLRAARPERAAGAWWIVEGDLPTGPSIVLEVIDDGPGIDDAVGRRIFEPFFSTKFLGRGLGLAAALGIVRAHGGAITVGRIAGRGARLGVHLPIAAGLG
jgi:PAS domain S-box-containing protein